MDTVPTPQQPEEKDAKEQARRATHTFESDLARAMDTTEAAAVQELLATARDREAYEIERSVVHRQRKWYTAGAFILTILALGAIAFGAYYYHSLTVRVVQPPSVGVFQSIAPVDTSTTDVRQTIDALVADEAVSEGKPLMVPLVDATGTTLSPGATLGFLDFNPGEPFVATLSLARLGVLNTGTTVTPFLILSTPTPELATKEFLIAEPKLLEMVAPALGIDLTVTARDIGTSFQSVYMYNLPVRTLTATNVDTGEKTILMYYGYATDNTIVIATHPTVLKAVYDTIIRQR